LGKKNSESFEITQYLFVIPALIFMLAFIGYPIVYNLVLSFQDINVMTFTSSIKEFIGFSNYTALFSDRDNLLNVAILNTLFYTVMSIIFQFTLGFAFAMFFSMNFRLAAFLRGLTAIAWLMPMTITALMFKYMLSPSGGIINEFLMAVKLIDQPIDWLINNNTAIWGVIIANIWVGIPFNMILLSTGLTTIPGSIYESADIDGARSLQKFFFITVPMIKPAIMAVLTLGFIYTFKVFDLIFIMTNGGPVNSTEVLSTLAYRLSFDEFNFSKGASVANVLFIILFCVSLIYLKLMKDEEELM